MTDSEIIKALECCIGDTDGKDCFGCPLYEIDDCQAHLNLAALDLINRQKADIDMLNNNLSIMVTTMSNSTKVTKAEAYKECIEKVSKLICDNTYPDFDKDGKAVNIWNAKDGYKQIDNLLKEMVGDNNA